MTGIERLHKLTRIWTWDCKLLVEQKKLADIAEQIEREQGGRVSRMRVLAVVTDMERHVSGVEGAEDSPVARWARELREALGGNGRDPAADVSMSAYDLLPQEDREAAAWVREHGGLDAVKRRWECLSYYADPVPRVCMERRLARRQRQIDECHAALRRRLYAIARLASEKDALSLECAQMRPRLMPDGMCWPVFEDGEPVRIGDEFMGKDGKTYTVQQVQLIGKCFSLYDFCDRKAQFYAFYGERVKRPAPKVLDADGAEIREKRDVWWICEGDERGVHAERLRVETICPNGLIECSPYNGGTWVYLEPSALYVNKPVPASDGEPLEVGQTVYAKNYGYVKCTVLAIEWVVDGYLVEVENEGGHKFRQTPDEFTHQRPALDADGAEIRVGDTVYEIKTGERYFVTNVFDGMTDPDFPEHTVECRKYEDVVTHMFKPDQLTHQRPDTWQRIEEDAEKDPCDYFGFDGEETCGKCPASGKNCEQTMARDLVRRARALAERERGE